jgi:uncharacterized protein YjiS (DUF1127 family)
MVKMSSLKDRNSAAPAAAKPAPEVDSLALLAAAQEARAREVARLIRGLARKVKSAFNTVVVEPLARWRRREALARELYSLDDRMLRDIGLTRSEIPFIVSGKRLETPHQDNSPAKAA